MTTTRHEQVRRAQLVIENAASLLEGEGYQKGYGLPEAMADAGTGRLVARVIAERWLSVNGLDVWWSDLLVHDGDEAAEDIRELPPIDPARLYGEAWEAQLGLFTLAEGLTKGQLNGLANFSRTEQVRAMEHAIELARATERDLLLEHCRQDVNFCTAHYATTPAGVQRRLRAMLALEGVAAYHCLHDVLPAEVAADLTRPVLQMLLPL